MLLLSWRGKTNPDRSSSRHERNRLDINCRDVVGNTALHYAAQSGLKQCVEFLVAHEADLFVENNEGKTACDLAVVCGHHEVALVLEVRIKLSLRLSILGPETHPDNVNVREHSEKYKS
jgi:ankyrin repeat protein